MRPPSADTPRAGWLDVVWSPFVHDARIDGHTVRYVDYGSPDLPALLLIHGLGGCWQAWLPNLPALAEHHRVIAVDLPGFGASSLLPAPADIATHADVLAGLLDNLGVRSVTVAGHSMGGLVALLLVERHPTRVQRLILVNAGGIALPPTHLAVLLACFRVFHLVFGRPAVMRAIARRPRLRRLALGALVPDASTLAGPYAAEVIPLMAAPGFLGAVAAGGRVAASIDTDHVTCPTLLIWGTRDRILPVAMARVLRDQLLNARLIEIPAAGHCPNFETPRAFEDALLEFTATI